MITIIKILLGGSPCTNWSIAQKQNRETKPKGIGWELFRNYVIAKERFQPDYFIYENNMSADKSIIKQIEKELGYKKQAINSALVSAQTRDRFYVHNIPNVELPKDRGLVINDILENGEDLTCGQKAYCLTASYGGAVPRNTIERKQRNMVAVRIGDIGSTSQGMRVYSSEGKGVCLSANGGGAGSKTGLYAVPVCVNSKSGRKGIEGLQPSIQDRIYSVDGKATALTTSFHPSIAIPYRNVGELETIQKAFPIMQEKYGYIPTIFNPYNRREIIDKSATLTTGDMATSVGGMVKFEKIGLPIALNDINGKARTLKAQYSQTAICNTQYKSTYGATMVAQQVDANKQDEKVKIYKVENNKIWLKGKDGEEKEYDINLSDGYYIIRKLTVLEAKRLQTVPDDYIMPCSTSQNYKMLGNGWTISVICHLLSHIPNIHNEEVVVLSMYDGMSCGQIALKQLGVNVLKYFAVEIDKYCIETTQTNFPNTIQLGDAMYVRSELFWYKFNEMLSS